jgi:hypothetical protein
VPGGVDARSGPTANAVVTEVGLGPSLRCRPTLDRPRLWSIDQVVAEPLQAAPIADIDQLIALHEHIFTGNHPADGVESMRKAEGGPSMVHRSILALALVLVAALAACSPSGGTGDGSAAPAASAAPSAVAPAY